MPPLSNDAIVRFLSGLWQLNRRLKEDAAPLLDAHGLDLPRFFLMIWIRKGVVYPKELSANLHVPPTVLSRHIDLCVKQGLLQRQIDEQDSRRTRLSLTPDGQRRLDIAIREIKAHTSERLQAVEPAKLAGLLDGLEALGLPAPPSEGRTTTRRTEE